MTHRVLVAGAPRSGTTWVAEMLATAAETAFVHEPDNHRLWPAAALAKAGLGRQPALDTVPPKPAYDDLWLDAFAAIDNQERPGWVARKAAIKAVPDTVLDDLVRGRTSNRTRTARLALRRAPLAPRRPDAGTVVVKSVHSSFCLPRVAAGADAVVVVLRDPRNAVASWIEMGWQVPRYEDDPGVTERVIEPAALIPPPRNNPTTDTAWAYGLLDHSLRRAAAAHPTWVTVEHEDLCDDPSAMFEDVFERAGLAWSPASDEALRASDQAGTGYRTTRVAAEQRDRWKKRLTAEQIAAIEAVLERF